MTDDSYYAIASWGPRPEGRAQAAKRLTRVLECLSHCDSRFGGWLKKGYTSEEAHSHPVPVEETSIEGVLKDSLRGELPGYGGSFGLWNGREGPDALSFFTWWGKEAFNSPADHHNFFRITFPTGDRALDRILQRSILRRLIDCFVDHLDPIWAAIDSNEVRALDEVQKLMVRSDPALWVGWITYISVAPPRLPKLPNGVRVEQHQGGGSIITLTDEALSVTRSEHIALVKAVTLALRDAGTFEVGDFTAR